MNTTTAPRQSEELARLEILRAYKKHMMRDGANVSPFTADRIIRYDTDVRAYDVPDIHCKVRDLIRRTLSDIQKGQPSQVVILAGGPGMGKSHLINYFRSLAVADELGYVLVCNSNHWKSGEFEECLLDWILEALVHPSPNEPHLLLEKIQDLAFQALSQLISQPGQLRRFKAKGASSFFRRVLARLSGRDYSHFQYLIEKRNPSVFRLLNFPRFAGYVCDRFLPRAGNPFHRYTLRVLLQYLFESDRERVLHWLRRRRVDEHFIKKLGADDAIDHHFKVIDVLKILISLFTRDVAHHLTPPGAKPSSQRTFFFAFDQTEGRDELFESEEDWFTFFAQLSELYNALPNVFILFTMTVGLRKKLYDKMEGQFKDRIRGDQRYWLQEVDDEEVLALYRQRVDRWLGAEGQDIRESLAQLGDPYLPFDQETLLGFSWEAKRNLRGILTECDRRFREFLDGFATDDPRHDYLVSRNELREKELQTGAFDFTEAHLETLRRLFEQAEEVLAEGFGLSLTSLEEKTADGGRPALCLNLHDPGDPHRWVRVFLSRLPYRYASWADSCVGLLKFLNTNQNFLWLVRPERIDRSVEEKKAGQVFARTLDGSVHTSLGAMLRLLDKRHAYNPEEWAKAKEIIQAEIKLTYLGEMLQHAREAIDKL
jgi:hypothetical protein